MSPSKITSQEAAVLRITHERQARGWSARHLSHLVRDTGCPFPENGVAKIEAEGRSISIDELVAFGRVFGITTDDLMTPPTKLAKMAILDALNDVTEAVPVLLKNARTLAASLDRLGRLTKNPNSIRSMARLLAEQLESAETFLTESNKINTKSAATIKRMKERA